MDWPLGRMIIEQLADLFETDKWRPSATGENHMRASLVAAALLVAGCATTAEVASENLDNGLGALVGQPVGVAIARLGEPIGRAPMGEDTVYGWGQTFTSVAVATYDKTTVRTPVDNTCVIRVVAGPDGVVKDWHYTGNVRACKTYSDRLAGVSLARAL